MAIFTSDAADAFLSIVGETALMMPEGPDRRRGHAAGDGRIRFEHVGHHGPGKNVFRVLAAAELVTIDVAVGELEIGLVAIVDEKSRHPGGLRIGAAEIEK